jgi:hypothetical protein
MSLFCLVIVLSSAIVAFAEDPATCKSIASSITHEILITDVANAGLSTDSRFGRQASWFVSEPNGMGHVTNYHLPIPHGYHVLSSA